MPLVVGRPAAHASLRRMKFWSVLLLLLAVVVFSVQNAQPATLRFLVWHFELSQALVIMLAAVLGIVVGAIAGASTRRRRPSAEATPPAPPR